MFGPVAGPNGQPFFPQAALPPSVARPAIELGDTFIPAHDLLLVRRLSTYQGVLELPESVKASEQVAEVVAVGPGGITQSGAISPICAQVGDKIFLPDDPKIGINIKIKGEALILVRNHQILGVFPKTSEPSAIAQA